MFNSKKNKRLAVIDKHLDMLNEQRALLSKSRSKLLKSDVYYSILGSSELSMINSIAILLVLKENL